MLKPKTVIFADGGSKGNTVDLDVGAWGVHVIRESGIKEDYSDSSMGVTNNMMELQAVIEGLKLVQEEEENILVITDSAYVCNGMNQKWYINWERNGWKTSKKTPVENKELWEELISLYREIVARGASISFYHINSHISKKDEEECYKKFCKKNEYVPKMVFYEYMAGNERVDTLATQAMKEGKPTPTNIYANIEDTEDVGKVKNNNLEDPIKIIGIIGEGASGKTVVSQAIKNHSYFGVALSDTTRPKREGELEGKDYNFISKEQFLNKRANGEFIESFHVVGKDWWYGYDRDSIMSEDGRPMVVVTSPVGMRQLRIFCEEEKIPFATLYLKVDWRIRAQRMIERGDDMLEISRRLIYDEGQFLGVEDEVDFIYEVDKKTEKSTMETAIEVYSIIK